MAYVKKIWKDYPDTTTPILTEDLNNIENGIEALDTVLNSGWIDANETWTYSSVDDPTGVITISGDVTIKYSLGMRIKFTNGGNTIYGIITKLAYSNPNTTMTFLHEIDPTDSLALHLMTNSAITNNYYSSMKVPYGFPMVPDKWTIESKITTNKTSGPYSLSGSTTAVYNAFPDLNIKAPIGSWNLLYTINMLSQCNTAPGGVKIGYSSAINNQDTFPETNNFWYDQTGLYFWGAFFGNTGINIEAPTQLYFLIRPWWSGVTNTQNFRIDGEKVYSFVKLICNYL